MVTYLNFFLYEPNNRLIATKLLISITSKYIKVYLYTEFQVDSMKIRYDSQNVSSPHEIVIKANATKNHRVLSPHFDKVYLLQINDICQLLQL